MEHCAMFATPVPYKSIVCNFRKIEWDVHVQFVVVTVSTWMLQGVHCTFPHSTQHYSWYKKKTSAYIFHKKYSASCLKFDVSNVWRVTNHGKT